jgi:plasmid stability protein
MAQVIVRNLDDEIVVRLKRRAKNHGRSLEQELRDILQAAVRPGKGEILRELDRISAMTPPGPTIDVVALIREDRDGH